MRKEEAEAAGSSALTERGAAGVRRDAWPHATWLASGPPLSAVSRMYSCGIQHCLGVHMSIQHGFSSAGSAFACSVWLSHTRIFVQTAATSICQGQALLAGTSTAAPTDAAPSETQASPTLEECGVQERLIRRWREVRAEDGAAAARRGSGGAASAHAARHVQGSDAPGGAGTAKSDFASAQQCELFNVLQSYKDVLFTCRPYPVRCSACLVSACPIDADSR